MAPSERFAFSGDARERRLRKRKGLVMPERSFKYSCCLGHGVAPVCAAHGGDGVFVGWAATSSERRVQFVRVYGLAPRGEALTLAPELLGTLRRHCLACRGSGWLGEEGDVTPCVCPGCDGLGGFWTVSIEEVAAARDQILRVQPEVEVGWGSVVLRQGGV